MSGQDSKLFVTAVGAAAVGAAFLFPHNHEEKMHRRIATQYQIEDESSFSRESVTVRVPATSANIGPGCTCIPRISGDGGFPLQKGFALSSR